MSRRDVTAAERFWEKVIPEPNSGCWLWTGSVDSWGYGHVGFKAERRWVGAHRFAYADRVGPIPEGLFVCHRCDTPSCVNPDHLFLGTHLDNLRDMAAKGRGRNAASGQTHCRFGHPILGTNRQGCLICRRDRAAKRRQAVRDARAAAGNPVRSWKRRPVEAR